MPSSVHNPLPSGIQAVAVVDPSSGGRFVAERLELLGIPVLRLRSDVELDEHQRAFFLRADKDAVAILPGSESGVIAAEKWAHEFELRGNDPSTSAIRRNKHCMAESLSVSGVPICRQALHSDLREAEEWAAYGGYPVVVKPPESSGSDLVRICRSPRDFKKAAQAILANKTKYDVVSEGVLVQEYMDGDEYTLDGVVFQGEMVVFAVGKYKKIQVDGGFVYDHIEFHGSESRSFDRRLVAYARDVVRALKVIVGAVHIEIMMTDRGPLLVELAARPHGGIATAVIDASFTPKFTDAIICSHLGCSSQAFRDIAVEKNSIIYFAKNHDDGTVKCIPGKKKIETLGSYVTSVWLVNDGDHVAKTVDLATCPALIHLANTKQGDLHADLRTLECLDASGGLIVLEQGI